MPNIKVIAKEEIAEETVKSPDGANDTDGD